ncbi:hypothetical protein Pla163_33910 [Planctomycetes bacterium Pla163]|uniref:Uncharacterized protein n=1 Tax=Rohdeia mirabilis TaxID=2528008 RepID=A0A518D457_9BACT|nr:hypothetical protein Pla163_33910 [Planctomycetes bacterium Pla163]
METMNVTCEACDASFRAPLEKAGRRVKCPACSAPIELPASDGVAHAVEAPASGPADMPIAASAHAAQNALPPAAIGGALAGGIIGALVWAGIVLATEYEIGYVAWGVGALVGGAAVFMGAAGRSAGIVCGLIALVSIFGGRWLSASWILSDARDEYIESELTPDLHTEYQADAELWRDVDRGDSGAVKAFMIERAYSTPPVAVAEVADFNEFVAPRLEFFADESPTLEEWHAFEAAFFPAMSFEFFKDSFSAIDLLFAFLGISTAFGLVSKRGEG